MYLYFGIIPLILFIVFMISYFIDPRKLINGLLFNFFLMSFLMFCLVASLSSDNRLLQLAIAIPIGALVLLIPFATVAFTVALFLNARTLFRKEGRRFSNSLTLLLGIAIVAYFFIGLFNLSGRFSLEFQPFFMAVSFIIFYFLIHASNFLAAYFLYQFNRPRLNQDFIIVLGSGLIHDKVPPLLASRINKAIEFYNKQAKVTTPPTIIFSGGQGPNEGLSEAEAMQSYALEKGIPIEHTLQESQSVNTYENMLFSKRLMDSLKPQHSSIFTTNNFHLFRAGLYARRAGLNSQGIGSKTAFYYWPNAMIREYIAIVVMGKKRHLYVIGTVFFFATLLSLFLYFFGE
ncbi:ElyC/SanA/YdcF family protein [Lysinibacillus louembei]|uniref:ElyC/SanA/YdcF family protein n=1 Tax=Lysinibacillus louembei TaxID=1470088 RepID=A0ABZ0RTZ0_9BACI|nr:ElyC/SanA/YdcF family protein [Lysinibacillus louembei]WPK11595.1 ElyC/SanA/YdcF family protein [Lysinibacillus louembei]